MTLYEDVGKVIKSLCLADPYYGMFAMSLNKQATDKVPTLAVGFTNLNVTLYINPKYWFDLNPKQKYGIIKHEILHLCYMHLLNSELYPNHKVDNIATDLEINQYIPLDHLPFGGITLDSVKEHFGVTCSPKQGRDVYYRQLIDKIPPEFDISEIEHHWELEGVSDADKAVIANQITYIMENIAEEIRKMQGTLPGEITNLLQIRKAPPRFDWKKHIRQWVGTSSNVDFKSSRLKPNPYFPDNPTRKITFKQNILAAIDTSGSVSDTELHEFMSEINNLYKFGHTINILCADSKLYDPYVYKGQNEVKIHGRGGTTFTPTINYFNEHPEYNCMLYFTDGEAELPPKTSRPMLWVISSRGTEKYIKEHNGKKLKIEN